MFVLEQEILVGNHSPTRIPFLNMLVFIFCSVFTISHTCFDYKMKIIFKGNSRAWPRAIHSLLKDFAHDFNIISHQNSVNDPHWTYILLAYQFFCPNNYLCICSAYSPRFPQIGGRHVNAMNDLNVHRDAIRYVR